MNTQSIPQILHHAPAAAFLSIARRAAVLIIASVILAAGANAQGVGISESSITPDASAILELRSTTRGFLMPRNSATLGFSVQGLSFYNTTSNRLNYHNGSTWLEIPAKADNLSVFASTTSLQLHTLLSDKTGSGLAVFATSPTLTTPVLGVATATSVNGLSLTANATGFSIAGGTVSKTLTASNTLTFAGTDGSTLNIGAGGTLGSNAFTSTAYAPLASPTFTGTVTIPTLLVTGAMTAQATTNQLVLGTTNTTTISATAPAASRTYTLPDFGANGVIPIGTAGNTIAFTTSGATTLTLPTSGTLYSTQTGSMSSANLLGSLSDKTGTGLAVFATGPAFTGFSSTGAVVNINVNSNFATNINTGTSTGIVSIGSVTGAAGIVERVGTGNYSLDGVSNSTYTIGASTTTGTISIGGTAQTGTITLGSSSAAQVINIGTGTGDAEITLGNAGTTAGAGVRLANGRYTKNHPTAPTSRNANYTATAADILDVGMFVFSAAATLTFPSAASLVAALPGTPAVGDVFTFAIFQTGNFTTTLAPGVGTNITIATSTTSANRATRVVYCRVTNVGAGTEAITVY